MQRWKEALRDPKRESIFKLFIIQHMIVWRHLLAPRVNHLKFTFMVAFTLAPAVKSSLTILAWPPWQATNKAVPPSTLATSTVAPAFNKILVISMKPPCAAKKSAVVPVCEMRNALETWETRRHTSFFVPHVLHLRQRLARVVLINKPCVHLRPLKSKVLCYPSRKEIKTRLAIN